MPPPASTTGAEALRRDAGVMKSKLGPDRPRTCSIPLEGQADAWRIPGRSTARGDSRRGCRVASQGPGSGHPAALASRMNRAELDLARGRLDAARGGRLGDPGRLPAPGSASTIGSRSPPGSPWPECGKPGATESWRRRCFEAPSNPPARTRATPRRSRRPWRSRAARGSPPATGRRPSRCSARPWPSARPSGPSTGGPPRPARSWAVPCWPE